VVLGDVHKWEEMLVGSIAPVILGWIKIIMDLSYGISMMSAVSLLGAIITGLTVIFFIMKDYISPA
jgi:hypothetical protein